MPTQEEKAKMVEEGKMQLNNIHKHLEEVYKRLVDAKAVYNKVEKEWIKIRNDFESLDRELAMKDGRFKILPSQVKKVKKVTTIEDLSTEQLLKIAEQLGVDLNTNEGGKTT